MELKLRLRGRTSRDDLGSVACRVFAGVVAHVVGFRYVNQRGFG